MLEVRLPIVTDITPTQIRRSAEDLKTACFFFNIPIICGKCRSSGITDLEELKVCLEVARDVASLRREHQELLPDIHKPAPWIYNLMAFHFVDSNTCTTCLNICVTGRYLFGDRYDATPPSDIHYA